MDNFIIFSHKHYLKFVQSFNLVFVYHLRKQFSGMVNFPLSFLKNLHKYLVPMYETQKKNRRCK